MEEKIKELLQEQLKLSDYHKSAVERYEEAYGDKKSEYLDYHKSMYHYYQGGVTVLELLLA